ARPRAAAGTGDLSYHPGNQSRRRYGAAGRAERSHGAVDRRTRLRARDRSRTARGSGRRAARKRGSEERISRRVMGLATPNLVLARENSLDEISALIAARPRAVSVMALHAA